MTSYHTSSKAKICTCNQTNSKLNKNDQCQNRFASDCLLIYLHTFQHKSRSTLVIHFSCNNIKVPMPKKCFQQISWTLCTWLGFSDLLDNIRYCPRCILIKKLTKNRGKWRLCTTDVLEDSQAGSRSIITVQNNPWMCSISY